MVMLKTQANAPLETIYEESASFTTSTAHAEPQLSYPAYTNGAINGLISARSLPPVNVERQRAIDNHAKPPIEVQFRDGSKRYIHPSNVGTLMINGRNLLDSSNAGLSSTAMSDFKYQQLFNQNVNKHNVQRKPPLVITIITANDIRQAGFTPNDSSSPDTASATGSTPSLTKSISSLSQLLSSPALSTSISTASQPMSSPSQSGSSFSHPTSTQQSILAYSQPTSSVGTSKMKKNLHKVSFAPLPPALAVQAPTQVPILPPPADQSIATTRPLSNLSQLSHEHSIVTNSSRNSTPSQSISVHSKQSTPSLQITLANESNNRHTSLNAIPTRNQVPQRNTTVAIGGGTHSAFRPFMKQMRLNHKSFPINKRMPFTGNTTFYQPSQQRQMLSYVQFYKEHRQQQQQQQQQLPTTFTENITNVPVHSTTAYNENSSNYQQQPITTISNPNNSFALHNLLNISTSPDQVLSVAPSPNGKWYNITSNNIYDIPRLARRFETIPLRITIPVASPHSNQKALIHHNTALERRLLNAGISPETVALYERILDASKNRPVSVFSPGQPTDQY